MTIPEILNSNEEGTKKALFQFNKENTNNEIILKFNLWSRYFFVKYFTNENGDIVKDAEFHREFDLYNLKSYRGEIESFVNAGFRGSAKTTREKLFIAFAIINDTDHYRKYIKKLCKDLKNSKQMVTDVYNILVNPDISAMYPEIFRKTVYKKEETMDSFTTNTGVKLTAGTVGMAQRGNIQENNRPDLLLFDDFETRETLRSAVITKTVWDNMEEARTGLSVGGSCIYNCNYTSEAGNVHKLILGQSDRKKVIITPIISDDGVISWPQRYTKEDIDYMKQTDDDFAGERLCKPSQSRDILFDRECLDKMVCREPKKEIAGFKIFYDYDPSKRYGSGHDVAGGVGLDSSTSCFIDFSSNPARVVATYKNNLIKPDVFGDEITRQSNIFGGSLVGIEKNNHGHATIARCKQLETNLYKTQGSQIKVDDTQPTEYGWQTNGLTKSKMLFDVKKAVEDNLLDLSDKDLISEFRGYTRNDLMDNEKDPRLTTRHFDLLISCAIAWQMKDFCEVARKTEWIQEPETTNDIGL